MKPRFKVGDIIQLDSGYYGTRQGPEGVVWRITGIDAFTWQYYLKGRFNHVTDRGDIPSVDRNYNQIGINYNTLWQELNV